MLNDTGIELIYINKKTPYFFIAPETEDSWKSFAAEPEKITALFAALGKSDVTDVLLLLYTRDGKSFTGELQVKRLGVSNERAEELIALFTGYKLIIQNELELNDGAIKISSFNPNTVIIRPCNFPYYCKGRMKPYLKA
jgi:hypothetical protein